MSFFGNVFSAVVKTALTPIAVVKDVVNVATGQDVDATKKLLEEAGNDAKNSVDDLVDGDVI